MAVQERAPSTRRWSRSRTRSRARSTTTLDALAGDASDVRIVAEVVRPITHCLIARDGVALDDVARVLSHPQALAQCARFLHERLPRARTEVSGSTAEAVRTAVASNEPLAAIGTRLAAELYGGTVLAEGVEDRPDNLTRFVWLAPAGTAAARPADEDVGRVLGLQRRVAGRARGRAARAGRPRREPDEDRVAAAAGAARPLHVLRGPRRRRRGPPRARRARRRSRSAWKRSRCSAPTGPPRCEFPPTSGEQRVAWLESPGPWPLRRAQRASRKRGA